MQDDLPLGAHLTSPRRGYLHHGVYAGNGRVIHYGGFNRFLSSRPVEEVSLDEFTLGRGLTVKAWVAPKFAGEQAVERARTRMGENRYRLLSNNCEHFAEWCIGGRSHSPQVETWTRIFRNAAARFSRSQARRSGLTGLVDA